MTRLDIKIPIRTHDETGRAAEYIKTKLDHLSFEWFFYNEKTTFASEVRIIKKKGTMYKHELLRIKKMMEILPQNAHLINEYNRCVELDKTNYIYDVEVVFAGDVAIEVNTEENSVLYYDGPRDEKLQYRDADFLNSYIRNDMLDDFYDENIKKLVLAIVMSIAIAYPEMNINCATTVVAFDGQDYKKEQFFSYYPIHNEAAKEYGQLFEQEVSFDTCFCWIKKNTSLADEKKQSPIIFSALSYVFNREMHEIFVYSIIGLESIYAADNKGISNTLQKNISTVFPSITKDMIKKLYRMRSKFVHGEIPVGNYHLVEEIIENERDYIESSRLAVALLIATIRNLIENNATTIKFKEMISFEYDGIIG